MSQNTRRMMMPRTVSQDYMTMDGMATITKCRLDQQMKDNKGGLITCTNWCHNWSSVSKIIRLIKPRMIKCKGGTGNCIQDVCQKISFETVLSTDSHARLN
jgi:hypothetical protein